MAAQLLCVYCVYSPTCMCVGLLELWLLSPASLTVGYHYCHQHHMCEAWEFLPKILYKEEMLCSLFTCCPVQSLSYFVTLIFKLWINSPFPLLPDLQPSPHTPYGAQETSLTYTAAYFIWFSYSLIFTDSKLFFFSYLSSYSYLFVPLTCSSPCISFSCLIYLSLPLFLITRLNNGPVSSTMCGLVIGASHVYNSRVSCICPLPYSQSGWAQLFQYVLVN